MLNVFIRIKGSLSDQVESRMMAALTYLTLFLLTGLCICQNVLERGPAIGAVGGSVWLKTNVSNPHEPYMVLLWSRNLVNVITYVEGELNTTYSHVSLNNITGSLELRDLTLGDAGVYYLDMVPTGSPAEHGKITLQVFEIISNASIIPTPAVTIAHQSSLHLTCEAQGNISSIEWTKDGRHLSLGGRISLQQNNRALVISPVKRADDGLYECLLSNPVSNMTAAYTLAVSYGPLNVTLNGPTEISDSVDATFLCSAESYPPAEFSWTFNGASIDVTGAVYKLINSKVGDSGNYTCTANNSNTGSKVSVTRMLIVYEIISNASIIPTPAIEIAHQSSLHLTCEAQGNISSIEWTKDGRHLSLGGRISLQQNSRVLVIDPVEIADDGLYECHLSNPVSNMTAAYTLVVSYGPLNVAISGPTEISVSDNATFFCSAESYPAAEFSWTFNGAKKDVTDAVYKLINSTVGDSGNYTCTASNPNTRRKFSVTRMLIVNGGLSCFKSGILPGVTLSITMMIVLVF
ncbi:carcinoembryonic antigen-related cell adhesion molecule 5-like [Engraulis encrasicolus]|uniref:carcinoembryonic antigen-related cell adhesion molecule 5-like n=1 Tax=Engraulis encrasicolus TaxID=184585 RepID=UPI002FD1B2BD